MPTSFSDDKSEPERIGCDKFFLLLGLGIESAMCMRFSKQSRKELVEIVVEGARKSSREVLAKVNYLSGRL